VYRTLLNLSFLLTAKSHGTAKRV
jgi:hypothetical protein